ncbi:hypothetical protein AR543_20930 [Paenibacillus bovis]|uniref:Uncharacterized protein n=1 Tax=Paenibacillus bovis TaxID=1616788 RepID=A0A172ZL19_9BACL|nr:hypothetical protein AR543_20930 [Paenibacillus bovis]
MSLYRSARRTIMSSPYIYILMQYTFVRNGLGMVFYTRPKTGLLLDQSVRLSHMITYNRLNKSIRYNKSIKEHFRKIVNVLDV